MSIYTAHLIRRTAAICLIVVALFATRFTFAYVTNLFPLSVATPFSAVMVTIWISLIISGIGLLQSRQWAFILVYIISVPNGVVAGFVFIPFIGRIAIWILPPEIITFILLYGVNFLFVGMLGWTHYVLRKHNQL